MLTFALSNWRTLAAIGAVLAVLALITAFGTHEFHRGAESVREADRKAVAHAVVKAAKVSDTLASSARKAGDEASASRERIIYRTNTIIQRIPNEVPASADPVLGVGFVRSYSASLGLPDDPALAGLPADRPYLHAAGALAGIETNNAECLKAVDAYQRVVGLYDQAAAAVNGFRP